jgi:hypothetical protein
MLRGKIQNVETDKKIIIVHVEHGVGEGMHTNISPKRLE